tara:strand:- start:1156 stop:1599 length:444 start_codon:yes stop_codon:yes gene_type:complete
MVLDIEKRKAYLKAYRQSPAGKKSARIGHWKHRGLHVDDYDKLYKKYLETTHCEKCGVEFVGGKRTNASKCADHDHNLQFNNFRAFLCHQCNCNDQSDNTSGTPNVSYDKNSNRWRYHKTVNKKNHIKWFKTKDEALNYKKNYESNL